MIGRTCSRYPILFCVIVALFSLSNAAISDDFKLQLHNAQNNCIQDTSGADRDGYNLISRSANWRKKITEAMQSQSIEGLSCTDIDYILQLNEISEKLHHESTKAKRIAKLLEVKENSPFYVLFEDSHVDSRPVKSDYTGNTELPDLSNYDDEIVEATNDASLEDFRNDNEVLSITIPKIAVNNYLWRLRPFLSQISQDESLHLVKHWPSVVRMSASESLSYQCPLRLHQIIWAVNGEPLKARLYSEWAAHVLESTLGYESMKFNSSLHYVHFKKSGFEIDDNSVKFREVSIKSNEFLFVPNDMIFSALAEQETTFYRACFVDASNLNEFRDNLDRYSSISRHYRDIQNVFSDEFDFSMLKSVSDIKFSDVLKLNFTSASKGPAPQEKSKDRRKRQSNTNLREWQESSKWNNRIASLTMPRPTDIEISDIHRNTFRVTWKSSFVPKISDRSVFGFNITFCNVSLNGQINSDDCDYRLAYKVDDVNAVSDKKIRLFEHSSVHFEDDSDRRMQVTFSSDVSGLSPNLSYSVSLSTLYTSQESRPTDFTTSFTTLAISVPETVSALIANVSLHEAFAVTLRFKEPKDDGGDMIKSYQVYAISADTRAKVFPEWHLVANIPKQKSNKISNEFSQIIVSHLMPETTYRFKMQAVNNIGASPMSKVSNEASVIHPSQVISTSMEPNKVIIPRLFGRQHPMHSLAPSEVSDQLLLVSDQTQTISVIQSPHFDVKSQFPVWRSNFTSLAFEVSADCIVTTHKESNNIDVMGKIVMTRRDRVTSFADMSLSFQRRGALSVIIVDDGKCRSYDQGCIPGANKDAGEYFGRFDPPHLWNGIRIPVVFAMKNISDALIASNVCKEASNNENSLRSEL